MSNNDRTDKEQRIIDDAIAKCERESMDRHIQIQNRINGDPDEPAVKRETNAGAAGGRDTGGRTIGYSNAIHVEEDEDDPELQAALAKSMGTQALDENEAELQAALAKSMGTQALYENEAEIQAAIAQSLRTQALDEADRKLLEEALDMSRRSTKKQEEPTTKHRKVTIDLIKDDEYQFNMDVAIIESLQPRRSKKIDQPSNDFLKLDTRKKFETLLKTPKTNQWTVEMIMFYTGVFPNEAVLSLDNGDIDIDNDHFDEFVAFSAFHQYNNPTKPHDGSGMKAVALQSILDVLMGFFSPGPDPMLSIKEHIRKADIWQGVITTDFPGRGMDTYECDKIHTSSWGNSCLIFSIAMAAQKQHGVDAFPGLLCSDIRGTMAKNFAKMDHDPSVDFSPKLSLATTILKMEGYDKQYASEKTWEKTTKRLLGNHYLDRQSFTSLYQSLADWFPFNIMILEEKPMDKAMMEAAGDIIQFIGASSVNELFDPAKETVFISNLCEAHYSVMHLKKAEYDRFIRDYIAAYKKAIPLANV